MVQKIEWMKIVNLDLLPHQELNWIEYKGRRSVDLSLSNVSENDARNILSKAISAFANSGGGYLLLGIDNSTYTVDDGGINKNIKSCGTKEWLEDIIPSLVEPALPGFNVFEITSSQIAELSDSNRAIYVIDIPDSPAAPHQANDLKYYGRIGGKSRPLSHQFILDILGRRKNPKINLEFSLSIENGKPFLIIILINRGNILANYVAGWVRIPKYLIPDSSINLDEIERIDNIDYMNIYIENTKKDIFSVSQQTNEPIGITRYVPILCGVGLTIKHELKKKPFMTYTVGPSGSKILWELAVDSVPMKSGEILFSEVIKRSKKFDLFDL